MNVLSPSLPPMSTELFWKALEEQQANMAAFHLANADFNNPLGRPHSPLVHALTHTPLYGFAGLLLTAGAEFNTVDEQGRTPLMLATKAKLFECVAYMLHAGVDLSIQDSQGLSVIDYLGEDNQACVDLLEKPCLQLSLKSGQGLHKPARL